MKTDLEQKQLRTLQYWYVDGTFEFSMGGLCLLLALYFYALAKFEETWLGGLLSSGMVLVIIFGSMGVNWLVMRMKEQVTFPRTGYVAYKRTRGPKRIAALVVIGLVAGLTASLVSLAAIKFGFETLMWLGRPFTFNWMPGISGLLLALAIVFLTIRTRIPRFLLTAALSLVIGTALMFIGGEMNLSLAMFYGGMGLALLVIGALVLQGYLRSAPPVEG